MKFRSAAKEFFRRPGVSLGVAFLALYRKLISPVLHAVFGAKSFCRFTPTCSEYARRALLDYGFLTGTLLTAWRVLRCNPFSAGGPDPVPAKGEPLFRRPRVGIFGGSFDPVHNAHMALAAAATETLRLDRLIFVPAAQSPLKKSAPAAPAEARCAMLAAAIEEFSATQKNSPFARAKIEISDWEIAQGGKSFSIHTAEHFEDAFPRARLFWIFGADQLAQLDRWHDAETLCRKVVFGAMCRDADALPAVPESLRRVARIVPIPLPRIDLSSTQIREALRTGRTDELRGRLPESVLNIVRKFNLYQNPQKNHADDGKISEKSGSDDGSVERRTEEKNFDEEAARCRIERDKNAVEPCWNDR